MYQRDFVNINTTTLLNLLSLKTDSVVKEKVESLSVNGKINFESLSKDKGLQTLLGGLFKDIATGAQTKENIASLLQNNKQNFSFKNLSEDIKSLIKFIQTDTTTNTKLETQLSSLKSSLIDMKNIDEKMIKSNISNSGVFLETKLAQQVTPVSKNVEQLLSSIKAQLNITTTQMIKSDIAQDLKVEIKSSIENILKDIKNMRQESNLQTQTTYLSKIDLQIKNLEQKLTLNGQNILKLDIPKADNLENIASQLKDQLAILNGTVNLNSIRTQLTHIQSNPTIAADLKLEIRNAIESLLKDIKNIQTEQNPVKQLQNLSTLETKIVTTQQTVNTAIVKNEIFPNLKELFLNLKEQVIHKNFIEIKNNFVSLEKKVATLNEQVLGSKNIQSDMANILEQVKSFSTAKIPQQQQQLLLQNILNNTQVIQTKLDTLPQALFENNLSKTTNFINDLKITASVIEEYTQNSDEPITKELKTIVDKINTQIDFYQLLSYSTNSTHTYLSFLQDEIEDSDIRFSKNNDESFSCQINLSLKKYGNLKILMILDNKNNININIGLEQDEFKFLVQENLQKLRVGINNIDLLLESLNIFSLNNSEQKSIRDGYGNSSGDLSFGLDIKA